MTGTLSVWNTLLREIRNPEPFYDVGPNTPEPLRWGQMHEEQAIATFWDRYPDYRIENPRFLRYHDPVDSLRYKWLGDSPDRVLRYYAERHGAGAVLEAKCPYVQSVHWQWLEADEIPSDHRAQCHFHMLVSGLPECWFISFDPRMESDDYRLFAKHLRQSDDAAFARELSAKVDRFLEVLDTGDEFDVPKTTADSVRRLFT